MKVLSGWQLTVSKFFIIPQRWVVSLFGFTAIMIAYIIRTALSYAITRMVAKHSSPAAELECQIETDIDDNHGPEPPRDFDWSEELQGFILASFYIGYVITHVPGGVIASRYGGKYTLILGMCIASFFTLITPVCVDAGGSGAMIAMRIIIGFGEGIIFPSCAALIASWTPLADRSKIGTLTYSGAQIGSIVGSLASGYLLDAYRWSSVFYAFGAFGIVWSIFFSILCYNSPDEHPWISDKEHKYLNEELGSLASMEEAKRAPIPWRALLKSPPVWALVFAQLGHNWGLFIMVTDLPKYLNDVLKFSIKENGLYSSLPYLVMFLVGQVVGYLSDITIKRRWMSITNVRKICTAVAAIGPACFIIGASYTGCDRMMVVMMFTVGMGFMGFFYSGLKVNNLDLAPMYAGVLMAITNGVGGFSGILSPYLTGVLTPNSLLNEWRLVFWVTFGVFVVTTIIYVIWASGEIQPWNDPIAMMQLENGDAKTLDAEPIEEPKTQAVYGATDKQEKKADEL